MLLPPLWLLLPLLRGSRALRADLALKHPPLDLQLSTPDCERSPDPHSADDASGVTHFSVVCKAQVQSLTVAFELASVDENDKPIGRWTVRPPGNVDDGNVPPLSSTTIESIKISTSPNETKTTHLLLCPASAAVERDCHKVAIDVFRPSPDTPELSQLVFSNAGEPPSYDSETRTYDVGLYTGEPVTVHAKAERGFFVDFTNGFVQRGFLSGSDEIDYTPKGAPGTTETFLVFVANCDRSATTVYTVRVHNLLSTNSNLATVGVKPGRLEPGFEPTNYAYYYRVPEGTSSVTVHTTAVNERDAKCFLQPEGLAAEPENRTGNDSWFAKALKPAAGGTPSPEAPPGGSPQPTPLEGDGSVRLKLPPNRSSNQIHVLCQAADSSYTSSYVFTIVEQRGGSTLLDDLSVVGAPFQMPFDDGFKGPYIATEDDQQWVQIRAKPRNAKALCSVNGDPVDRESGLSRFYNVPAGGRRNFEVAVHTEENPIAEMYHVQVSRPAPWYRSQSTTSKLGDWVGKVSTAVSATRGVNFLSNAKWLQSLSLTSRLPNLPEGYAGFASGMNKYNLQFGPNKWAQRKGHDLRSDLDDDKAAGGEGMSDAAVATMFESVAAALRVEGSNLSERAHRAAVADLLAAQNQPEVVISMRRLLEDGEARRETALQLNKSVALRQALVAYCAGIVLTTAGLLIIALVYLALWAVYLHDVNEGWTVLRQDFPAVLKPTRFWTFLMDYALVSYLQCCIGILVNKDRHAVISIMGLDFKATSFVWLAATVLVLFPLMALLCGISVLLFLQQRGEVHTATFQRYVDPTAPELKAFRTPLRWLPIISQLCIIEITSVAPVTRFPTSSPGISDGPIYFHPEDRAGGPWMVGDPADAALSVSDPEVAKSLLGKNDATSSTVSSGRHHISRRGEADEIVAKVTLPEDGFASRLDTMTPALYSRHPEAFVGYGSFKIQNAYDQTLSVTVDVQLRHLAALMNLQSYTLRVPRKQLSLEAVDNFNLLFGRAQKGNLFYWAIDRILLFAVIVCFAVMDSVAHRLIVFAVLSGVVGLACVPAAVSTASSKWWQRMDEKAKQKARTEELEALREKDSRRFWPFRRPEVRANLELLRQEKQDYEFFGLGGMYRKAIRSPMEKIKQADFWDTRLWFTLRELTVESPVLSDFLRLAVFATLCSGAQSFERGNTADGTAIASFLLVCLGLLCLNSSGLRDWRWQLRLLGREAKIATLRVAVWVVDTFRRPRLIGRQVAHWVTSLQRVLGGEKGVAWEHPGFTGERVRDIHVHEVLLVNNEVGVQLPGRVREGLRAECAQRFVGGLERGRFGIVKTLHVTGSMGRRRPNFLRAMPVQLPFKQFFAHGKGELESNRLRRLAGTIQIVNYNESRAVTNYAHGEEDDSFLSFFCDPELMPELGELRVKTAGHGYVVRFSAARRCLEIRGPGIRSGVEYSITTAGPTPPPPAVPEDLQSQASSLTAAVVGSGSTGCSEVFCQSGGLLVVDVADESAVPDLHRPIELTRMATGVKIMIDPEEIKVDFLRYRVGESLRQELILRHKELVVDPLPYQVRWSIKGRGAPVECVARAPCDGYLCAPWDKPQSPDMHSFLTVRHESEGSPLTGCVIDVDPRDTDAHQFVLPPSGEPTGSQRLAARVATKALSFWRAVRGRDPATEPLEEPVPCTIVQCVNPIEGLFRVEPNFEDARLRVRAQMEQLQGLRADLEVPERWGFLWAEFMSAAEFIEFWERRGVNIVIRGAWVNPVTNANHMYMKQHAAQVQEGTTALRKEIARRLDRRLAELNTLHDKYVRWAAAYSDAELYSCLLARDMSDALPDSVTSVRPQATRLAEMTQQYAAQLENFRYPMTAERALLSRRAQFDAQLRAWREELSAWLFQMEGASLLGEQGGKSCAQATVDDCLRSLEHSMRRTESAPSGLFRTVVHYAVSSVNVRGRDAHWRPDPLGGHFCAVRLFPGAADDLNFVDWGAERWTPCFLKLAGDKVVLQFPHEVDAFAPTPAFRADDVAKRWTWNQTQGYYIPLQCFDKFFLSIDPSIQEDPSVSEDVKRMHAKLVLKKNTVVHVDDRYVKSLFSNEFWDELPYGTDRRLLKIRLGHTVPNSEAPQYRGDDKFFHGDKCTVLPLTFRFHHCYFNKWQSAIRMAQLTLSRRDFGDFDGRVYDDDEATGDRDAALESDSPLYTARGGLLMPQAPAVSETDDADNIDDELLQSEQSSAPPPAITPRRAPGAESSDDGEMGDEGANALPPPPPVAALRDAASPKKEVPVSAYEGEFRDFRFSGKNGRLYDDEGRLVYEGEWLEGERSGKGRCVFNDHRGIEWEFEGRFECDEMAEGTLRLIDQNELSRLRNSTDPADRFVITQYEGTFHLPSQLRTKNAPLRDLRRAGSNCAARTSPVNLISPAFLAELFSTGTPIDPLGQRHLTFDIRRTISAVADDETANATTAWVEDNFGKQKATTFGRTESLRSVDSTLTVDAANAYEEYLPHRSRWVRRLDPSCGYQALTERFSSGEVLFADGARYRGQMRRGLPHGQGVMFCAKCDMVYSGMWRRGKPHGEGRMIVGSSDGDSASHCQFHGSFVDGLRDGRGVQLGCGGGVVIRGSWREDKLNERACGVDLQDEATAEKFPNTFRHFKGGVEDDVITGRGKLEWADHTCYKGEFQRGIRHGQGAIKDASNRTMVSGTWVNDFPDGRIMAMVLPDGKVYTGDIRQGQRQGIGELYERGVSVYEGLWMNDVANGRGTLYAADGDYEGEFVNGKRQGKGRFQFKAHPLSNGKPRVYEGDWKNDLPDGVGRYVNELGVENTYRFKNGEIEAQSVKAYKGGMCGKAPVMGVPFKVEPVGIAGHHPKYWGLKRQVNEENCRKILMVGSGVWAKHMGKPFVFVDPQEVPHMPANALDAAAAAAANDDIAKQTSADSLASSDATRAAELVEVRVLEAQDLVPNKPDGRINPYVKICAGGTMKRTKPITNGGPNPTWRTTLTFAKSRAAWLEFQVFDKDTLARDELLGAGDLNLNDLLSSQTSAGPTAMDVPLHRGPDNQPAGLVKCEVAVVANRFLATGGGHTVL